MLYRSIVDGKDLVLECDPRLQGPAQALLETLGTLNEKGPSLRAGSKIQYGWSILTLQAENGFLRVCEPAFDGNPLEDIRRTVDTSLEIFEKQVLVLRRSGLSGVDVLFSDEVFISDRALDAPNIFLKRQNPRRCGDSGWYIGNVDAVDGHQDRKCSEILRVFEILQRRVAVLQALALPPDYVVVMRGDSISEILDQGGKNYWS